MTTTIDPRYTKRWNRDRTVLLELLQCEAITGRGRRCAMVPIYRHPDGRLLCYQHGDASLPST